MSGASAAGGSTVNHPKTSNMDFINELSTHLAGGNNAAHGMAAFLFVLLGAVINVLYDVQTRNAGSIDTPVAWDWKYFWKVNRWRFGLNLVMAMAVARFFHELTGMEPKMVFCFLAGLLFDAMFVVYKKLRKRMMEILDRFF